MQLGYFFSPVAAVAGCVIVGQCAPAPQDLSSQASGLFPAAVTRIPALFPNPPRSEAQVGVATALPVVHDRGDAGIAKGVGFGRGQIGGAKMRGEQHGPQVAHDVDQDLARGQPVKSWRLLGGGRLVAHGRGTMTGIAQTDDNGVDAGRLITHASEPRPSPSNSAVLRYRSPESGRITTMVLPACSGRWAMRAATAVAAPPEMPARMPSCRARRRA
jgi:hypothetical protein